MQRAREDVAGGVCRTDGLGGWPAWGMVRLLVVEGSPAMLTLAGPLLCSCNCAVMP